MPTRSGRTFSPTPPATQAKGSNRRGSTSQNGRVTRASRKRTRADSDASLMELGSEQKPGEGRPIMRKRAGKKSRSSKVNIERPEVIDLTRDDDETHPQQPKSHHRTSELVQYRNDAEREAIVSRIRQKLGRQLEQRVPAAMPNVMETQPLWQVDLVGAPPHPGTLTASTLPEDIGRHPLWQVDLIGAPPPLSTLTPVIRNESISQEEVTPAYVVRAERQSNQRQKAAPPPPARVMFTYFEARNLMYEGGRNSAPQPVPPYTLSTGEHVPYPVTKSYHLGAMGRYTKAPAQKASSGSVVDSSAYVFDWGVHVGSRIQDVPRIYIASLLSSPNLNKLLDSRRGLFEALRTRAPNDPRLASPRASQHVRTLPVRSLSQTPKQAPNGPIQASPSRHRFQPMVSKKDQRSTVPIRDDGRNNGGSRAPAAGQGLYIFTFGPFRGKAITEAPMTYLRSLEKNSQLLNANPALSRAFDRHFPHGIFRHEVDNYCIDGGPYELRRLSEVPNAYVYGLQQDTKKVGESVVLQHALKQRNRELGWSNSVLDATIRKYHQEQRQPNFNTRSTRS